MLASLPLLSAVDENHYPATGFKTKSVSFSRLRINHYFTKSEEEYMRKVARPRAGGAVRPPFDPEESRAAEERTGEPDETILIYLNSLEERLGVRSGSA